MGNIFIDFGKLFATLFQQAHFWRGMSGLRHTTCDGFFSSWRFHGRFSYVSRHLYAHPFAVFFIGGPSFQDKIFQYHYHCANGF